MDSSRRKAALGWLLALSLTGQVLHAAPRSADEARQMARGWLRTAQGAPLHERLTSEPGEAVPLAADGQTVGYVFALRPKGFIVTSADDTVEPVIAFSSNGRGATADGGPLAALLNSDLPRRPVRPAAGIGALSLGVSEASRKWAAFAEAAGGAGDISALANNGLAAPPADLRVAPLVQSRWQEDIDGQPCFNTYTPGHYVCGCIGTSWGQIMRFHQYPTNGIGALTRTILVDGVPQAAATRGGNGAGGPYAWASMPLVPDYTITAAQRQAVGALTYDIVVAVSTNSEGTLSAYTADFTSAYMPPFVMTGTFGYASTIRFDGNVSFPNAINANLDAGFPVNVALPGHAVVCDGYGFQSGTAFHHLNMGWNGLEDAWYAFGDIIEAGEYYFEGVEYVYANIFPASTGEIVSGRVLDGGGSPLANATVTLSPGGRTATTDSAGIYAFSGVASGSSVTLAAAKTGYSFAAKNVTLGTSQNYTAACGNRWGNDITGALSGSYRLVSGRIANSSGAGLANIEVVFGNGGGSTFTDYAGDYSQALPTGWSGSLAPARPAAYSSQPAYAVANLQADTAGTPILGTLMCFVRHDASGAGDGSSWADAYTNLVAALNNAPADVEIWTAAGTYTPGSTRASAFFFSSGRALYGGFGGTETRRDQRDWRRSPTVLSGEIGSLNTVTDNCYTVVRGMPGARIDGFTITGGNADYAVASGYEDDLAQCLGGGVFVWPESGIPSGDETAEFLVDHCLVTGNRAVRSAGPGTQCQGGGLYGCLVRNSLVRGNAADAGGGVTYCRVESSTIVSNAASGSSVAGGALWFAADNAIIYDNTAGFSANCYTNSSTLTYSCTTPLPTGTGNISAAPLFVGAAAGNFMIATNSPCKNAGAARAWTTGAQDLFGDSRASGTAPDMGAYELQATHPAYAQLPESPLLEASAFSVSVPTRYGWSYRLQHRASLTSGTWQNVSGGAAAAVGDGAVKTLTDAAPPAGQRFYQVLAQ